ncbi:unnamed protein product [Leptosia nina]|uniref:Uncharacterized protein n=1 Tax=Leptosia nina TaxID=320188 RepID=A0AAV1JAT5_9NEOP
MSSPSIQIIELLFEFRLILLPVAGAGWAKLAMRRGPAEAERSSSSSEGAEAWGWRGRDAHGHRRCPLPSDSTTSTTIDTATSTSRTSLTSSISRFRLDFEQFKCKARIFGESMSLCQCIADDFNKRLGFMEKRLVNLEQRQRLTVSTV